MTCPTHQNQVYSVHSKVGDGRTQIIARLECWLCRGTEDLTIRPDFPPSEVLRKFRQKGWETHERDKRRCRHSACEIQTKPKGEAMNAPAKHHPAAIIPMPDMVTIRKILGVVEDHFDEANGRYLGDWSDKKVSAEVGVGWAVVAKVREDSGLKIKGDPEIMALRADLDSWIDMGKQLDHRLSKLETR
jgi:hypothetical protein